MHFSSASSEFRHSIRTYLNHIVGYADILIADAREYDKIEFVPAVNQLLQNADVVKRLIYFHFDLNDLSGQGSTSKDIRKVLFQPLMLLIGDTRKLLLLFRQSGKQFVRDTEHLLSEANKLHDLVESELIDLELRELSTQQESSTFNKPIADGGAEVEIEKLPSSLTIVPDESIEGRRAKIPGRILVIDDSPVYHRLIKFHLEALGHKVICFEKVLPAIELLESSPEAFDIIILDILMPDMSGAHALKFLKQHDTLYKIPVIMMSSLADPSGVARCIQLGAEDYIPKDFDVIILCARLDACMEKKRLHEQQAIFIQALMQSKLDLANELSDAAEYIVSLLPQALKQNPVASLALIPSAQLGGDFCAYHWLDENKLAIYLLDISGHGIRSSLLAVSISNLILNRGLSNVDFGDPGSVVNGINRAFQNEKAYSLFFSFWYGVYDKKTNHLVYSSGGSPPACVVKKSQPDQILELESGDLVLGADEGYAYPKYTVDLEPGDKLYIYSDGLFEISKPNGRSLGLAEFHNLIALQKGNPEEDINNLIQSVLALTMSDVFEDDISIISLQV